MALSVDWNSKIITIPKADLTALDSPVTVYEMDTNAFRLEMKAIEASEEGIVFEDSHQHNTEVTIAGTTFARTLAIINGYQVKFEDGQYTVRLVGSNNNIFDVQGGILVRNQVQVIPRNSAGLIVVTSGSGLSAGQDAALTAIKSKTDQLGFTKPGEVDANVQSVNDTTVGGTGDAGSPYDPWGPA